MKGASGLCACPGNPERLISILIFREEENVIMRHIINKQNVILRSMLLLFISVALLGCMEARFSTRPPIITESYTHVVHIPGTYVYAVPDIDSEVFFYGGRWFSYHDNYWFRATVYSGPWVRVRIGNVPSRLHRLPGHYRQHIHSKSHRIHRSELKKHWKSWERDRHWDHDGGHGGDGYKGKKQKKRRGYYKQGRDDGQSLAGAIKEKVEGRSDPGYGHRGGGGNRYGNIESKKDHKKDKYYKQSRERSRPLAGAIKEKVETRSDPGYGHSSGGGNRYGNIESKKDHKKDKYYKQSRERSRPLAGAIKEKVERQDKEKKTKVSSRDNRRAEEKQKKHKKKDNKKKAKKNKNKKDRDGVEDSDKDSKKESKEKAKRHNNDRRSSNSLAGAILKEFNK